MESIPGYLPPDVRVIPRPAWQEHAACRGVGAHIFYEARYADEAAAFCGRCPVTAECHDAAVAGGEHGVWAGLDRPQRRAEQRRAKKEPTS